MALINDLIEQNWLRTPRIIEAFQKIKRVDFIPSFANATEGKPEEMQNLSRAFNKNVRDLAELNQALPIGFEQTISQPLVVAFMLEQLQPEPGDKILDIGSGSGWTSALLGEIVGEKGKVIAIEIIPELKNFGEQNAAKYNFIEQGIVEFICTDGSKGYPNIAVCPELAEGFDKILASASAEKLPRAWKEQLKINGRIVASIGLSIWTFIKKSENNWEEIEHPGFTFVPLVKNEN